MQKMKTSENDTVRSARADADALRARPARLAHPVAVGQQRDGAADAADERQRVRRRELGLRAPTRDQSAPDHSTISSADAMMAPNFRPTNHLMIDRKRSYRPNHTMANARDGVQRVPTPAAAPTG